MLPAARAIRRGNGSCEVEGDQGSEMSRYRGDRIGSLELQLVDAVLLYMLVSVHLLSRVGRPVRS